MLTVIPGTSHLKALAPTAPAALPSQPDATPADFHGIVYVALEAAFGMRSPTALPKDRFHVRVRNHVAATLRTSGVRGPVRITRIDARLLPTPKHNQSDPLAVKRIAALEAFGSCQVGARTTKAFAARLEMSEGKRLWVMQSLRVF
ncbi:hypothetical protein QVA66_06435 [Staphylococcus chromogenes]|nr:hypothetical protein [Staphylococcus chromogenes]